MKKVYDKPWVEVVDFHKEAVMSDDEIILSLPEDATEDGGEV